MSESESETRPFAWRTWRALLITVALLVGLINGCPVPSDRNLERWPPALVPSGRALRATQGVLLTPFNWIGEAFGVDQRWSLFASANPNRFRLWIEARWEGWRWQILYRAHDPAHDYRAEAIEYRRLRGAWNVHKRGPGPGYAAFADWIAADIFANPDLRFDRVRVRMEQLRVSPRSSTFAGSGEFQHELVRERSAQMGTGRP
jgi:hypothetical protein